MPPRKTTTKSAPDGKVAGGSLQPATSPAPSGTASAPGEAAGVGSSAAAVGAAAAHTGDHGGDSGAAKAGLVAAVAGAQDYVVLPEPPVLQLTEGTHLKVIGPKVGRWRAGRHFGPLAAFVPIEELTPEQISAIEGDPMLLSSVVSDPDERG